MDRFLVQRLGYRTLFLRQLEMLAHYTFFKKSIKAHLLHWILHIYEHFYLILDIYQSELAVIIQGS